MSNTKKTSTSIIIKSIDELENKSLEEKIKKLLGNNIAIEVHLNLLNNKQDININNIHNYINKLLKKYNI